MSVEVRGRVENFERRKTDTYELFIVTVKGKSYSTFQEFDCETGDFVKFNFEKKPGKKPGIFYSTITSEVVRLSEEEGAKMEVEQNAWEVAQKAAILEACFKKVIEIVKSDKERIYSPETIGMLSAHLSGVISRK